MRTERSSSPRRWPSSTSSSSPTSWPGAPATPITSSSSSTAKGWSRSSPRRRRSSKRRCTTASRPARSAARTTSTRSPRASTPREVLRDLLGVARVEDLLRRQAALARHPRPAHQRVVLARGVRVGVDAERHAAVEGALDQAPVEIEAVRIAVDLDHHAALAGALEDLVELHRVAVARQEQAPGEVAEERDVRIVERAEDPLRHLVLVHVEAGVDAGDDEVELCERAGVAVVDRSVGQDVGLGAAKDAQRRDARALRLDLRLLLREPRLVEAAGVVRGFRMVGEPDVLEAAVARRVEHLEDRVAAVAERRVDVERAAEIADVDELFAPLALQIVRGLAALRLDPGDAGVLEEVALRFAFQRMRERVDELLRPRRLEQHRAEFRRLREVEQHVDLAIRDALHRRLVERFDVLDDARQHGDDALRRARGHDDVDVANDFEAAPHAAGDLGVDDVVHRGELRAHGLADVEADRQEKLRLAPAPLLDAVEDLLLRLRAEAVELGELAGARGRFELVEVADAEGLEEDADLLEPERRHAHELEDAGRVLLAEVVEVARRAAAHELLDDRGGGFADAGRFLQVAGGDEVGRLAIKCAEAARGALECQRLEAVRFAELEVARDFVERAGDREFVHRAIIASCKAATASSSPSTAPAATTSSVSPRRSTARPGCSSSACRRSSPTAPISCASSAGGSSSTSRSTTSRTPRSMRWPRRRRSVRPPHASRCSGCRG